MRLDQWLWAVRAFKSRTLAAEAIKAARVRVDGDPCKASHEVRAGELVTVTLWHGSEVRDRTLRVLGAPESRVGAKLVAQFAEEVVSPT